MSETSRRPRIGRPPGVRKPVLKRHWIPGNPYCPKCWRGLNANNRSGLCYGCAPHHPVLPTKKCFEARGHRWRTIRNTKGYWAKACIHCEIERPFTDAEIAVQNQGGS
ncbi:hypothetical protein LCGC14_0258150 [marine sediment metagenome]|uniref:Uncharacterized protein n=1 Tax=marine sediment metagenome TaxID=412755 RepID=A0A0F9WMN5_9ZZZZ